MFTNFSAKAHRKLKTSGRQYLSFHEQADGFAGVHLADGRRVAVAVAPIAAIREPEIVRGSEPGVERGVRRKRLVTADRASLDGPGRADRITLRLAVFLDGAACQLVLMGDRAAPPRVDPELADQPVAELTPSECQATACIDRRVPLRQRTPGGRLAGRVTDRAFSPALDFHARLAISATTRGSDR